MSLILNIETSTKNCSVAIGQEGVLCGLKGIKSDKYVHGEKLHLIIKEIIEENNIQLNDLSAIAVASGPGSFTGLRIGVAAAKGLAFSLNIPLISVRTTELMINSYKLKTRDSNTIIFPMIDARRDEVYTAGYDIKKKLISPIGAHIIDEKFLEKLNPYKNIYFTGNGAKKFNSKFNRDGLIIDDCELNCASGMIELSHNKFIQEKNENLAYFNPFYLKDFMPNKKNNS